MFERALKHESERGVGERRGDIVQNLSSACAESVFRHELWCVLVFHYRSRWLPVSLGEYVMVLCYVELILSSTDALLDQCSYQLISC